MVKAPAAAAAGARTNWGTVFQQALSAAQGVLGPKWNTVSQGAASQIDALNNTAQYIAKNKSKMKPGEYKMVVANQKLALQNVLLGYQDINIAVAEETVQAVWAVIGAALKTSAGVAIK
jgi:hypothetical protein